MVETPQKIRHSIYLFLFLTLLFTAFFDGLILNAGQLEAASGRYIMGEMWAPGAATILTSLFRGKSLAGLGWQWGDSRFQWMSYLIPLVYALVAYGFLWVSGLGGFPNPVFIQKTATSFHGMPSDPFRVVAWQFLLVGSLGVIRGCANTLGEELGWRAFLVPSFYQLFSYTQTSLLTGLIWALWHFPLLIFSTYNNGNQLGFELTCFSVMIISSSFAYTWLRIKSNSLWTAVLFHSSHNLFIQSFFSPLTFDTGLTTYWYDEFGLAIPLVSIGVGFYFWRRRKELPSSAELFYQRKANLL